MPTGSTIVVTLAGVDITNRVLPGSFRFESQLNAVPGTWELTVKDLDHTSVFVTGKEMSLDVDGTRLVGGFALQVTRTYPFPAMDTTTIDPQDTPRYWRVRGVDFNRLFDTRILHNSANYLKRIPDYTKSTLDGVLIKKMWADYIDTPAGFDTTTFVDSVGPAYDPADPDETALKWLEQGVKARDQMADFAQYSASLWYFDAAKNLHYHAIEDSVMRWGFSDQPNYLPITASPVAYQGSTIGPREIDATESGDHMVNDALFWGGSPFGSSSGVAFAREQNSGSQTDHGRWQRAETHFNEQGYFTVSNLALHANIVVNGSPGAVGADQNRGLRYPQWLFKFVWFAHQVPTISGVRNHVLPGYLTQIEMNTFGPPGDPLIQILPCRAMAITIPTLDPSGDGYVQFEGTFGLNPEDTKQLWSFLLKQKPKPSVPPVFLSDSADPGAPDPSSPPAGAQGDFSMSPFPDGAATVFTAPYAYVSQSTMLYLYRPGIPGGVLLRRGLDYTESDPASGAITMGSILPSGDILRMSFTVVGATAPPVIGGSGTNVLSFSGNQAAWSVAAANLSYDTLEMAAGTYHFRSCDYPDRNGAPLTIRPAVGAAVVFSAAGDGDYGDSAFYALSGQSYVTLDGSQGSITFEHYLLAQEGMFTFQLSHHLAFKNLAFHNIAGNANASAQTAHLFYISHGAHHITIQNVTGALMRASDESGGLYGVTGIQIYTGGIGAAVHDIAVNNVTISDANWAMLARNSASAITVNELHAVRCGHGGVPAAVDFDSGNTGTITNSDSVSSVGTGLILGNMTDGGGNGPWG